MNSFLVKRGIKKSRDLGNSYRGYGRAAALGLIGNGGSLAGGLAGTYLGKEEAKRLAKKGASDEQILEEATKRGRLMGALAGAAAGTGNSARFLYSKYRGKDLVGGALVGGGINGLIGAAGGHLGAKKNVQDLLDKEKRRKK